MEYIRVRWIHNFKDEPITIFSEIDESRNEVRKIEIYHDGRVGYASVNNASNGTRLSMEPIPTIMQIAADPEFGPKEISKIDFEEMWSNIAH